MYLSLPDCMYMQVKFVYYASLQFKHAIGYHDDNNLNIRPRYHYFQKRRQGVD